MLELDFQYKFRIGTDWDKDGKLFLHQTGKLITYTRPAKLIANIKSIKYQENPPLQQP